MDEKTHPRIYILAEPDVNHEGVGHSPFVDDDDDVGLLAVSDPPKIFLGPASDPLFDSKPTRYL